MYIRHLYYFLAVVKEMSFTRAAQQLHISQQALSVHIQKLEERYGIVLFERKPNLRLTLAGEQMAFYAKRILQEERHMNASLADIVENKKAKLTIGSTRSVSNLFIPLVWEQYCQQQPHIIISLIEALTIDLDEMLEENKIDLYIGVNASPKNNTRRVSLAQESFYCVINPVLLQTYMPENWEDFILSCRDGIDLLQLKNFPFIAPPRGNLLRTAVEDIFSASHTRPKVVFETSNHDLIFQLSNAGNGVGLLTRMILLRLLRQRKYEDNFYVIPIKNELASYSFELVYKPLDMYPRFLDVFIDITKKVFFDLDNATLPLDHQT